MRRAVASLLAQDFPKNEFEIVIVDDASPSGLPGDVVSSVASGVPRVQVVTNPRNLGQGGSRHAGALAATGEFLVQTEDDATYPPGYLSAIDAEIVRLASEGIAWGSLIVLPRRSLNFSSGHVPKLVEYRRRAIDALTAAGRRPVIGGWIFARDRYLASGGYRSLRIGEDTDLVARMTSPDRPPRAVFSTYWSHEEPVTFSRYARRMFRQGYLFADHAPASRAWPYWFAHMFGMAFFCLCGVACFAVPVAIPALCLAIYAYGWAVVAVNPDIRGAFLLAYRDGRMALAVAGAPIFALCEAWSILAGRIWRGMSTGSWRLF